MRIIREQIEEDDLRALAKEFYGHMVKGVVDLEREIVAFGGEFHADANAVLVDDGSQQVDVWGFNWYFDAPDEEKVEYTSLINIRPHLGNRQMEIIDAGIREKVRTIVLKKII
ncbi:MAG: hypothetical protein A3D65_00250 [Candidatus Lloydbacteria bacterium RIFCSPHIGHO2_02_FULL_50_13]|uniref:Uncharacterized protein n=1 Tax=Candidatus Lloydbacteria bacterium RIFCSPHIGHO2_02_FULL_50_13 TaxID=1798661 RepID=A0A1G2D8W5_9BACT|nr:MAG: hypothetical protein A3D65_00250 [Candidatus Lloydbacteria bacterium RIFCSPHIGHO2_02_FULL_50_13]